MTRFAKISLFAAAASSSVRAQVYTQAVVTGPSAATQTVTYTVTQDTGEDIPLASKVFNYPDLPYQADSGDGPRGTMQGYNLCNSTTLGANSLCATGFVNSVDDFCLWGSATPNEIVADVEGEMVAYCTSSRYGTRVLPPGALQGVQFIKTPDYVEVVGMIDQTALNLNASDYGGEEDPHGADSRGNPLGSLLYSSAFGVGPSSAYQQVHEWSYFIGSGVFCFKACDPAGPNAAELCQHVYDRIGCAYNDPADYNAINGTFQTCLGDDQLPAGVYVENGQTLTYEQPAESLGAITTIPYTASVPATSSCTTFTSASLYTLLGSASNSASSSAVTSSGSSSVSTGSNKAVSQSSKSASAASSSSTSSSTSGASAAHQNIFGLAALLLAVAAGFCVAA